MKYILHLLTLIAFFSFGAMELSASSKKSSPDWSAKIKSSIDEINKLNNSSKAVPTLMDSIYYLASGMDNYKSFIYDENHNLLSSFNRQYNAGAISYMDSMIYTYNEDNFVTSSLNREYEANYGAVWINNYKKTISYENKNVKEVTTQRWKDEKWQNDEKETMSYVDNSMEAVYEEWDEGVWKKNILHGNEWNDHDDTVLDYYKRWSSDISDWIDLEKIIYVYDENSNVLSIERKNWDKDKSEWYLSNYETFEYNKSNSEILHKIESLSWTGGNSRITVGIGITAIVIIFK